MRMDAEQFSYRIPPEQRGFYELSSAIVRVAVEDYRTFKKMLLANGNSKRAQYLTNEMRTFFSSEMFEALSGIENPNAFMMRLDEQIEKEFQNGEKRKRYKSTLQYK